MKRASLLTIAVAFVASFAASGCRRATQADCQLIIEKSVELQLKESNRADNPEFVAKEKERLTRELDEAAGKNCVGRFMSNSSLNCVRSAQTTQELERCVK
jgi:small lipoprotein (TIGR04454 family)